MLHAYIGPHESRSVSPRFQLLKAFLEDPTMKQVHVEACFVEFLGSNLFAHWLHCLAHTHTPIHPDLSTCSL